MHSELELRQALGEIASRTKLGSGFEYPTSFGGSVVIAAPLVFSNPVTIPFECLGVTIRASARFPILPNGILPYLFKVEAQMVTIKDLFVSFRLSPVSYFEVFCKTAQHTNGGGKYILLSNNIVYVDRVYVDETEGQADHATLNDNKQLSHANATHDPSIDIDSSLCEVKGGLYQDGGGDTVRIGPNGGQCSISTVLSFGGVTTTASAGENVVDGCRRTGTLTLHSTDASGLNT